VIRRAAARPARSPVRRRRPILFGVIGPPILASALCSPNFHFARHSGATAGGIRNRALTATPFSGFRVPADARPGIPKTRSEPAVTSIFYFAWGYFAKSNSAPSPLRLRDHNSYRPKRAASPRRSIVRARQNGIKFNWLGWSLTGMPRCGRRYLSMSERSPSPG
jgi:hypothetical protein